MTIYVDNLINYGQEPKPGAEKYFGNGKRSCHMGMNADGDLEELHYFAASIGLKRSWFQNDARYPHYDLSPGKRTAAINMGAIAVDAFEFIEKCRRGPSI